MAEWTPDLTDVLHTAEAQREAALAASPTEASVASVRTAVRAARTRRTALAVTGTAAAVLLVGGVVLWSPRAPVPPAAPASTVPQPTRPTASPTPAASPPVAPSTATVEVGGLPPMLSAAPDELRDAPPGTVLALWTPDTLLDLADGAPDAGHREVHLLLVRPDGEVRHVVRAPDHAVTVGGWDRAAASASVITATGGGDSESIAVDLLTGATTPVPPSAESLLPTSPDGTTTADVQGAVVRLRAGAGERELELPSRWCRPAGWSDATHLLLTCFDREPRTLVPAEADGPALVLLDTVTGGTTRRALVTGDVVPTDRTGIPLGDGSVVAQVDVVGREVDGDAVARVCGTGLGRFDGLAGTPLPAVPAGDLVHRGLVAAPGRVVVAGPPGCPTDLTASGMWALDLATGRVDELLPVHEDPAAPFGLLSSTTWR
ncbi:hypothetical protein [Cellulomonas wangsupingiae]|uniref:Uncharacterized protein n=1 Tax=Cellulomonas wangsupingiae TaxID=2968085 RepID=A0ABY5K5U6_9CELL|nr:hypothetical protein [Cellulomonas wangsupingiae]MCC2333896.1 hypothetical protein [Cellulomonas wangsupingiae]UUI65154.1 hypothetical protein NP075_18930 [Cellulomonas wangsupingiae]